MRWAITVGATAVSTCALDAVATVAGLVLASSGVLRSLDQSWLLGILVCSYVAWGLGLRVNLRANLALLARTGTSTNALSKVGYDLAKSPRARGIAAAAGYLGVEIAKEVPYYAGAFGAALTTTAISSSDALIFLAGANLGAAVYEYGLGRATRAVLGTNACDRPAEPRRSLSPRGAWKGIGLAATAAICTLPVMSSDAVAQTGPTLRSAAPSGPVAVPGEIVVAFRSGVDASDRAAARAAADVSAERNLLAPGAQLVKIDRGQTVDEAITALEQRRDVRYAEPNWIYHADSTTPDDPRFGGLWGLHNTGQAVNGHTAGTADVDIDAPEAWDRSTGSASTVVAVVDSGVAWDHPDLASNMWSNVDEVVGNGVDDDGNGKVDDMRGWDFVDGDNNPWDYNGHGTHVAGTIAARGNNGVGVTGVAWQASIMPLRALDTLSAGTNANIADAFTYAAANGARVVNASLSGFEPSQAMSDAIANSPNTLFVASAGNLGENSEAFPRYPCNDTAANLICVAATDSNDALASFSNYGAKSVDLAAPGVDIDSTWPHEIDSFSDGFESGLGNWTVQSGQWLTVRANNSTWLADSPGTYADNADWAIRTSSKVDLGTRTDCALRFTYATLLQAGFDWLYVQSSTDGTTWTDLSKIGDTDGSIQRAFVALHAGGSRYYRFRLTSDASVNENGVFIDDVRISCPGGTYGSADYTFADGTSMAAPHVAGAATVLFSDTPAATVDEVKTVLLNSGDALAGLSGKTVSGRRLNLNAALTVLVHKAKTTTTITSHAPNPSVAGQLVTVRYDVTVNAPDTSTPTGNVTVTDGTRSCTGTVAAGQCAIAFTSLGTKSLTATYAGDANHYASPGSARVSHQVNKADTTTTTITSDAPDPSNLGQTVRVNWTVAVVAPGGGTPTEGLVVVSDGENSCTAAVEAGGCNITLTTPGARTLTATYLGNASFNASAPAEEAHRVYGLPTTTTITADDPDPSVVGQAVTVRYGVTVDAPGTGTPTGDITVTDGIDSCTGTVAAGQCTITLTSPGSRSLTATYAGDDDYAPSAASASVSHQVNRADTTSTITSDEPDASVAGQAVTVRYSVVVDAPGAGTPTGSVTVGDGVDSCAGTVAAGQCTIVLSAVGSRTLTADYAGDGNFNASSSSGEPHTVSAPSNPAGSPPPTNPPSGGGGAPPPPGGNPASAAPAHVSGASLTRSVFRISAKPALAQISRRRAPVGTAFTYTLDAAATVRLDFSAPGAGRKTAGKCLARNKRNQRKPKCALARGSLTFAGHAGLNTVRFAGWLSRTRKLTPGRYELTITAITPGVGTTSQKLRFRVVR